MEHCIHLVGKHFVMTVFLLKKQRKRSKAQARVDGTDNNDDGSDEDGDGDDDNGGNDDGDAPWATLSIDADADITTEAVLWDLQDLLGRVFAFTTQVCVFAFSLNQCLTVTLRCTSLPKPVPFLQSNAKMRVFEYLN